MIDQHIEDKYKQAEIEREKFVQKILLSESRRKVLVAGPGTGKTYLFQEILKGKNNSLTLTFINALVDDLSLELKGLSNIKTLHGFALTLLKKLLKKEIKIFSKLSNVIEEDAKNLINEDINFDKIFQNKEETNKFIPFYKKRKDCYGNYYGHTDIIFALVKILEKYKTKIPTFDQIVVDEFQDFNLLEVCLIDLLAEKSPIFITGDDDQALYFFKNADPNYIRSRYKDEKSGYEPLNLPFCSRSSRVIVGAVNDIIEGVNKNKALNDRIPKPYIYFEDRKKDKDKINEKNSKIIHCKIFERAIPQFIEKEINKIAEDLRGEFSVLIISPARLKCLGIAKVLKSKGFQNVVCNPKENKEYTILDGLKILVEDLESKLGWRVISKFVLEPSCFKKLLKETHENDIGAYDYLIEKNGSVVQEIKELLKIIKQDKPLDENVFRTLISIGLDPNKIIKESLKKEVIPIVRRIPGTKKIEITATTIPSSKGLAADYVFITHFDDIFFKTKDQDICNFLVALTRAKRRVYLLSIKDQYSALLGWIKRDKIEFLDKKPPTERHSGTA